MGQYLACFKAYDVRGKVPSELNPEVAYAIGRAYAQKTGAKTVCVGYDIRLTGPELAESLSRGLNEEGCDVIDLGMIGTEMVYFATAHYGYDGGIMITASHNPPEYNGMKMVRQESRPISGDTGLYDIEELAHKVLQGGVPAGAGGGAITKKDCYTDFVQHLLKICPASELKNFKVLASPGNGAAGIAMEALMPHLPLQVTKMMFEPDGHFPNGVPNPILEESRAPVEAELAKGGYDLGIAWDGDYDRCFLLDEKGNFIEGYYIVGLLAQAILVDNPGATIIYDPRLMWNTLEIVAESGGRAVMCKSGHAFIKEKMRAENAVYGGEMSAHHYFRDHWYCDSGMIPMLLVLKLMAKTGKSLGELVGAMIEKFPCSGEVNSTVDDVPTVLARAEAAYPGGIVDKTDGISIEFPEWRFNLRGSNTEPVIRLNVETRADANLMRSKTEELLALIRA
ncbi:MAG: phosphomannomutase CpsG [Fimbriimonadaceae bacterium]|nr:MAG: phosphomannomutase CpsG [Fimbriimonadaceae bacterium]